MGLDVSLSIANSGLAAISKQFAVISQNVSNANSPNYTNEAAALQADSAGSLGLGVRSNAATLTVNTAVQGQVFAQGASVAYASTAAAALSGIDQVMGAPDAGTDLPSLLGNLQSQFSALDADPGSQTQAQAVVGTAQTLTNQINTISGAIGTARQSAQNDLVTTVAGANSSLQQIATLNQQIVALQSSGQSTADLQNQRAVAEQSLSSALGATFVPQTDGSVLAFTSTGLSLPVDGSAPLSIANANVGANAYYSGGSLPGGGLPGVMLGGTDVTASLTQGTIGADLTLRDGTLPTLQAGLDEFSQNLASQFQAQGLTLFTDPNGNVPQTGTPAQSNYVGFASEITVNPAVVATPSLVRDGTNVVTGSVTGASAFTPNPVGGPSGFTTLINRVLTYALGNDAQAGVAQPASNTTGLGPAGTLALAYGSQSTLAGTAAAFAGAEAAESSQATASSAAATSLQSALQSTLAQSAGVDVDQQMSNLVSLQNAYAANAKVITTIQAMWGILEQMI
jgi:flagellar hook-associated protein 1 FlgK